MINGLINISKITVVIFSNRNFSKSEKGNRFLTFLKMSIFSILNYFTKNTLENHCSYHNALIFIFANKKVVMILFFE